MNARELLMIVGVGSFIACMASAVALFLEVVI